MSLKNNVFVIHAWQRGPGQGSRLFDPTHLSVGGGCRLCAPRLNSEVLALLLVVCFVGREEESETKFRVVQNLLLPPSCFCLEKR